jgi:hypothetical protein
VVEGLGPGDPGRQLEQQRPELPVGEPQQEHAGEPEQQPRFPRRPSSIGLADAPDGTDRFPVPCSTLSARTKSFRDRPGLVAKANAPGGRSRSCRRLAAQTSHFGFQIAQTPFGILAGADLFADFALGGVERLLQFVVIEDFRTGRGIEANSMIVAQTQPR